MQLDRAKVREINDAIENAQAAGYTHVQTLGGAVPLTEFEGGHESGLTFDAGGEALVGPMRDLTTFEEMAAEKQGLIGSYQARSRWPLV